MQVSRTLRFLSLPAALGLGAALAVACSDGAPTAPDQTPSFVTKQLGGAYDAAGIDESVRPGTISRPSTTLAVVRTPTETGGFARRGPRRRSSGARATREPRHHAAPGGFRSRCRSYQSIAPNTFESVIGPGLSLRPVPSGRHRAWPASDPASSRPPRQHHPGAIVVQLLLLPPGSHEVFRGQAHQTRIRRQRCHHRFEPEVLVADVDQEHTAGLEHPAIERRAPRGSAGAPGWRRS